MSARIQKSVWKNIQQFFWNYKLLLFAMLIVLAGNFFVIKKDYTIFGLPPSRSQEAVFVTQTQSIKTPVFPLSKQLRGFSLHIANAYNASQSDSTDIVFYKGDTPLTHVSFSNALDEEEETFSKETNYYVELDRAIPVHDGEAYFIEVTSNVAENSNAIAVFLDTSGNIAAQFSYIWFSKRVLNIAYSLIGLIIVLFVYCMSTRKKPLLKKRSGPKAEDFFLYASIPLCIVFTFIFPPFRTPDEQNHFLRAYGILKGFFIVPESGAIPGPAHLFPISPECTNPFTAWIYGGLPHDAAATDLYDCVNMALYNPISYIFQTVGMALASLFTKNTYILLYAGRLCNAAGATALLYAAITYIPFAKGLLIFISLLPMNIQERASLSSDAITYASIILLVSYCLSLRFKKERTVLTTRELVLLYALTILVASCKVVYFIFGAAVLLIPRECFKSKKSAALHTSILLALAVMFAFAWFGIANAYLKYTHGGVNSSEKIRFLLTHPLGFVKIVLRTVGNKLNDYLDQAVGKYLGSMDIAIDGILIKIIYVLLFLIITVTFFEKSVYETYNPLAGGTLLLICFLNIALIFASLFVQWTTGDPYRITGISGVQGRYFLPASPFLIISCLSLFKKRDIRITPPPSYRSLFATNYMLVSMNIIIALRVWCSYALMK